MLRFDHRACATAKETPKERWHQKGKPSRPNIFTIFLSALWVSMLPIPVPALRLPRSLLVCKAELRLELRFLLPPDPI
jgi:hypothetical protein